MADIPAQPHGTVVPQPPREGPAGADAHRPPFRHRGPREYAALAARGFAMGAADVVPGVSGGTMAFILGIYEELIGAARSLAGRDFLLPLLRLDVRAGFRAIPWKFMVSLGLGILLAVVSLARFLERALETHPALLWAFFFGLVLASILAVSRRIRRWSIGYGLLTLAGAVLAYFVVGLVPTTTPDAPWFLVASGFAAICAMMLPGISGSFVLVLLGKYQVVLSAVNQRDLAVLGLVAVGAIAGLVTFAQFLGWLFKRYHDATVAALIGLMAGSLRKIWPWKETVEFAAGPDGQPIPLRESNVLPEVWTQEVTVVLALAVVGFAAVLILEYWANRPLASES